VIGFNLEAFYFDRAAAKALHLPGQTATGKKIESIFQNVG
jgi:hypothetical protein